MAMQLIPRVTALTIGVFMATACGGGGETPLSLNSTCAEYLALDADVRHEHAVRLSREAQADNAGYAAWGLNTDAACGAQAGDTQLRETFNLQRVSEPSAPEQVTPETSGPDPIALERLTQTVTGIDSCQLFTAEDFFDLTGELPASVTGNLKGDGDECIYVKSDAGGPALQLLVTCAPDGHSTLATREIWDGYYTEEAPAEAPPGAKAQTTGLVGVQTNGGACIVSTFPGWGALTPTQYSNALQLAAQRQDASPRNYGANSGTAAATTAVSVTGRDYASKDALTDAVPDLVAAPGTFDSVSIPEALDVFADSEARARCFDLELKYAKRILAVDFATYAGEPVLVMVKEPSSPGNTVSIEAVGVACAEGIDDMVAFDDAPIP